ncbi:MAG: hypothetical protein U0V87_16185 [Acidobacteriota bacterium]
MNKFTVAQVLSWSLGFVAFWAAAVITHALWRASNRMFDPLPAEEPHPHHHDHDDHGDHHAAGPATHGHSHH